jgi:ABC-2 type transport system permease protein
LESDSFIPTQSGIFLLVIRQGMRDKTLPLMFRELLLLAKTNGRAFRAKALHNFRESKLLLITLLLFLVTYLIAGYVGFRWGLKYLYLVPGVGLLLVERVLYMLYFFFFVMLIFSNAVLLYSGLFRGKEMSWLLTLPLNQRAIFCWKIVESLIVSSWGLLILSLPLLLAFGSVLQAPPMFYVKSAFVFIPYLVLPATIAGCLVIFMVRIWGRVGKALLWGFALWVVYRGIQSWLATRAIVLELDNTSTSTSIAIKEVLGQTEIATHPLSPSTWMSEMILHWAKGYASRGLFYSLLLLSYTLLGGWLCVELFSRLTYTCWNASQSNRAARTWKKSGRGLPATVQERAQDLAQRFRWNPWRALGLSRPNAALLRKDAREYLRDPSQWIPTSILFGLLFLYSFNIQRFTVDMTDPFWSTLISYLNFGVCSLAVSTLCTRFIYPLFSLEGRRLWIVGLAPMPMTRIFWVKLALFAGAIAMLTSLLMLISGTRLLLPWEMIFRFIGAICLISIGLTSLSLGLGVLFPNYQESNPSKIVSGYGGTLCLILNFLFIILFLTLFVTPGIFKIRSFGPSFEKYSQTLIIFCNAGVVVLGLLTTILPIYFSLRRIKKLEILGKL